MARSEGPHEPVAWLAADRRVGAREQLRIISGMIGVPMVEPAPRESLADAVVRLGGSRRLFIDMPRDPRIAACETDELRPPFARVGPLNVLCTMPLSGPLARYRLVAPLVHPEFDVKLRPHEVH